MTANKNGKATTQCRSKAPRDIPDRCKSVSPPPTSPAVRGPPHPLSDGEDPCLQRRNTQPGDDAPFLRLKNQNNSALTTRLPKSRGIGRLDTRLSVFKPGGGGGRGQKENRQEGVSARHGGLSPGSQGTLPKSCETSSNAIPPQKLSQPLSRPTSPAEPYSGGNSRSVGMRRRISRWEYCRVELPRMSLYMDKRALGERVGGSEGCPSLLSSPCSEKAFDFHDPRKMSTAFSECSYPGTEDEAAPEVCRLPACFEKRPSRREAQALFLRSLSSDREGSAVLSRVQKIEQALRNSPGQAPQYPSSCYAPGNKATRSPLQVSRHQGLFSKQRSSSGAAEPGEKPSKLRQRVSTSSSRTVSPDLPSPETLGGTPVNPIPKPKRTFEYEATRHQDRAVSPSNGLPLRSPSEPTTLLATTPPVQMSHGQRAVGSHCRTTLGRDSCVFEDTAGLPASPASSSHKENGSASTGSCRHFSSKSSTEENTYEDIVVPHRENPYEDVDLKDRKKWLAQETSQDVSHRKCPPQDRKCVTPVQKSSQGSAGSAGRRSQRVSPCMEQHSHSHVLPSACSLSDNSLRSTRDTLTSHQHMRVSKLVQRINSIYRSKRGKRTLKKLSSSHTEMSSVRDDNSESESDSDDRFNVHTQRLLRLQSLLRCAPSYRTLELQLLQWQERRELFEYFVVVSLKRRATKSSYTPEVTYQFPKLERLTKQMKEAEQRLKAIPQFCFPDAKDWNPVSQYNSETFSFMLTGEDGDRRFGYCRRLLPTGNGPRLPEVYCVISRLGCFDLFSKILDEVEKRRGISAALVYPFMRSVMESPFPAPGKTIKVKTFLPGAGKEEMELRRPADFRLEHVDLQSLFSCLSVPLVVRVFASLLLERRVIFVADKLSTLSSCAHAVLALLYPFSWQHTFIPVLPAAMLDMVCCPTPFLVGLLSSSLPRLKELPLEETLMVDLRTDRFIRQMDDEATLLPRKLQAALEQALEQRDNMISQDSDSESEDDSSSLNSLVSEAFIRFFLETVGHYPLFLTQNVSGERFFQREGFRKAVVSRSVRRFLGVFMESQMFAGFIQDQELRRSRTKGLFEVRVEQYLGELPDAEQGGVNRFLRGLGSKMKFLQKKN